jgi:hypothetical protein
MLLKTPAVPPNLFSAQSRPPDDVIFSVKGSQNRSYANARKQIENTDEYYAFHY